MTETVSTTREQVAELTLIAPVRPGYVSASDGPESRGQPIRYADRLRAILEVFQGSETFGPPSIIRLFAGIHFAHWSLIDGDTRLLLSVSFDGDWRTYMRNLVIDTPGFLHLIFANCVGWPGLRGPEEEQFANFSDFVARYEVKVSFFYAHCKDLTARDIDWLRELRSEIDARIGTGIAPSELQTIYATISARFAPASLADRRVQALAAYAEQTPDGPRLLKEAESIYLTIAGSLYPAGDVERARQEAFGVRTP